MSELALILAKTRGGLGAVAGRAGFVIIDETEQEFASLTTLAEPDFNSAGVIDTGVDGWVAIAVRD